MESIRIYSLPEYVLHDPSCYLWLTNLGRHISYLQSGRIEPDKRSRMSSSRDIERQLSFIRGSCRSHLWLGGITNVWQVGKSALLLRQTLQQDPGLREGKAARKRGANIVSHPTPRWAMIDSYSLSGEASKLVIDNYIRSLAYGNKYVSQSLPKVLTLWLEHASTIDQPFDPKKGDNQ